MNHEDQAGRGQAARLCGHLPGDAKLPLPQDSVLKGLLQADSQGQMAQAKYLLGTLIHLFIRQIFSEHLPSVRHSF